MYALHSVNVKSLHTVYVSLELILSILYKQVDLQRPDALNITNPAACKRFIERLKKFKYMDWKAIDPTCLEYVRLSSYIILEISTY